MTTGTAVIPDDAETRGHEWQARGAASDRRAASTMRTVMLLVFSALVVWLYVQLT